MQESELKTHPTLINYVIKEYELRVETHSKSSSFIVKFWNWLNFPL